MSMILFGTERLESLRILMAAVSRKICLRCWTAGDICDMNLVSNITGLVPATPTMDYPIAKPSELADILIPEEDGGILKKTGVVDVFHNLRGVDEASFAGGEYLIVKCDNAKMWELLEAKGHVVGRNMHVSTGRTT